MRAPLLLALLSCGKPFDGGLKPTSFMAAFDLLVITRELHSQGCDFVHFSDDGWKLERTPDLSPNPQTGVLGCGHPDGEKLVYSREEGTGCTSMLHEIAHAMGYDHWSGPPLMWEWVPTLPEHEQARQFIELTGCKLSQ